MKRLPTYGIKNLNFLKLRNKTVKTPQEYTGKNGNKSERMEIYAVAEAAS